MTCAPSRAETPSVVRRSEPLGEVRPPDVPCSVCRRVKYGPEDLCGECAERAEREPYPPSFEGAALVPAYGWLLIGFGTVALLGARIVVALGGGAS